jgi:peptidyl-prolyl cis-trans isomerase B (cyclophilin B)
MENSRRKVCIKETAMTDASNPLVLLETSSGDILLELFPGKAQKTVENFLAYVDSGFYENTLFHRVIKGFMIQGGGYGPRMDEKPTRDPIRNEADNGLQNERGAIAMARTADPHSASAQFFINLTDNGFLDHTAKDAQGWGYCVFGKVSEGMEVVDAIAGCKTSAQGMHDDVPVDMVLITSAGRFA